MGGDFYDILPVEGGHLVVLGDVTGQGGRGGRAHLAGAPLARTAARFDPRPPVLSLVNQVLREQPRLSLVTAVCALVATEAGRATVTVASAGHPLPLRRRPGGAPVPLGDHGVLLGVEATASGPRTMVELAPGDTLLFYTDGVTETPGAAAASARTAAGDASRARASPEELLAEIERALREFRSGAAIDDRAMLALRFTGGAHRRSS